MTGKVAWDPAVVGVLNTMSCSLLADVAVHTAPVATAVDNVIAAVGILGFQLL